MSLFAGKLAEVAVFAQTQSVVGFVVVLAVRCKLRASVTMIARLAESFRVEWFVCVRARVHFLWFALLFLDNLPTLVLMALGDALGGILFRCFILF